MTRKSLLALLLAFIGQFAVAEDPPGPDADRGELLYSTHCLACHSARIHWREKRLATDWPSLLAEVRHWEDFDRLGWTDDDVAAVARYLNARHYRHPMPD